MSGQKQCTDLHTKHYGIKEELHEKDSYTHLADRTLSAAPMEKKYSLLGLNLLEKGGRPIERVYLGEGFIRSVT